METEERIERFLRNQMTAEEEKDFREELKTNKELRDDATMIALLIKGTLDRGKEDDASLIRAARETAKDEMQTITGRKPDKWKRLRIWMPTFLSAAAMFIAVFAINRVHTENIATTISEQSMAMYAQDITVDYAPLKGGVNSIAEEQLAKIIENVERNVFLTSSIVLLEDYYQMATGNIACTDEGTRDYLEGNKYIIGMTLIKACLLTGNKEEATYVLDDMIKKYPKDKKINELKAKMHQ